MDRLFDRTSGDHCGLYVASYGDEGVCKIGITGNLKERFTTLQTHSWADVTIPFFAFPFRRGDSFSQSDNFSILKASSEGLERSCLKKAKEIDIWVRGEFLYASADDAVEFVRKVAKINGYKIASPTDILAFDADTIVRPDDRGAFYSLANAAGLAVEAMRYIDSYTS